MGVKKDGMSQGGSRILRYGERRIPVTPEHGDPALIEAISEHITRYVGPIETVWHEQESDLVHLDIHVVPPNPHRDAYTLITSGMSQAPMKFEHEDGVDFMYAELMITLPPDWPMDESSIRDENYGWPLHSLYSLARLPHAYDTWLGTGHTIPNGDPPEPFSETAPFVGVILCPPVSIHEDFHTLYINPDKEIEFLALYPLYPEEMDLKLRKGADAIFQRFAQNNITDYVDPNRKSTTKKRWKWF